MLLNVIFNGMLSIKYFSFIPLNILSNTFGKGYLAPIDYIFLLLIIIFFSTVSIGIYHALLRSWINSVKHPMNLRLILFGFTITMISIFCYSFLIHVYLIEVPIKKILWPNLILFLTWVIYSVIILIWGKQIRRR